MIRAALARLIGMLFPSTRPALRPYRLTSWLLVGPALDGAASRELKDEGVTRVLDLRAEGPASAGILPEGILWRRVPVVDDEAPSAEQFEQISSWVAPVLSGPGAVYVHCQGGLGRGPTVAIALLMSTGMAFREAIRLVSAARPGAAPTARQLEWLQALERELADGRHRSASSE